MYCSLERSAILPPWQHGGATALLASKPSLPLLTQLWSRSIIRE
jgi:hypothetical protein